MKKAIWIVCAMASLQACTKETKINNTGGTSTLKDTTMLNISYGSHGQQVYDIYLPAQRDSNTATILLIHGGAWKAGQKEEMNDIAKRLANTWKNVAVVNMNYRLASNANGIHHAQIMKDIENCINHVLSNKTSYVLGNKMAIAGASAGGQLAMIYAYNYNIQGNIKCVGNIFGPSIISDWQWYNSTNLWLGGKVGDILTEYVGQAWDTAAYKAVSPYWNVDSTSQATITFHGNLDPIVPVYQSQWLKGKLNASKVANEYHEYIAFHSFDATQTTDVVNKMVAFFQTHLK